MTPPYSVFSLAGIKDLPTLPSMASMAISVADDPESSAADLLRVFMSDPPLAARLLRVANSAFFRRGGDVSDLQTAIVRLGFSNVRNLILGISVIDSFDSFFVGSGYSREEFWRHSVSVGSLANLMAPPQGLSPSTAFVVGLLHDIGKLILDGYMRAEFREILTRIEDEKIPFIEAEKKTIHTNHASIGGDLLEMWKFPKTLVEPVRWHHAPGLCTEKFRPYAILVNVADYYCNAKRLGHSGNPFPTPPLQGHMDYLMLNGDDVEALAASMEKDSLTRLLLH